MKAERPKKYENPVERIYYRMTPQMVSLTKRELEICKLIARGLRNSEISEMLGNIAHRGVESHVRNMLVKLGLKSRVQICAWALKHRLVELDDL